MYLSISSTTFLFTSTLLPSSKFTQLSFISLHPLLCSYNSLDPFQKPTSISNSSHSNTKCLTSSTFPPLHSTHLSSSTILHLFLSSNLAKPDLNRNLNLTATCPFHEPMYFSSPFSYLTFLYYFKLLFLSTSSCQFPSSVCFYYYYYYYITNLAGFNEHLPSWFSLHHNVFPVFRTQGAASCSTSSSHNAIKDTLLLRARKWAYLIFGTRIFIRRTLFWT